VLEFGTKREESRWPLVFSEIQKTLKIATAVITTTLEEIQQTMRLKPESQSSAYPHCTFFP
jgi:hypothetical protein